MVCGRILRNLDGRIVMNVNLQDRVSAGADFLDHAKPGWASGVSTEKLNAASINNCVVGQLFGHYVQKGRDALATFSERKLDEEGLGFVGGNSAEYRDMTRLWRVQINLRLMAST